MMNDERLRLFIHERLESGDVRPYMKKPIADDFLALIHSERREAVEEAFTRLDRKLRGDHEEDYQDVLLGMFPPTA